MGSEITITILSDGVGDTAHQVAKAALRQFAPGSFRIVRQPKIASEAQLAEVFERCREKPCVFFYTFATQHMRDAAERFGREAGVIAVDILGPVIGGLGASVAAAPRKDAGAMRRVDERYFERIDAMEFSVSHDDGRGVESLGGADIVLIGVSRTGKTPLSMYLASKGFRTANIPLVPESETPHQLFEIDPQRVFGLVTDADVLTEIRGRRAAELGGYTGRYADREAVLRELQWARQLMRRMGCLMVRTDNRAIEETAQEIIRHVQG